MSVVAVVGVWQGADGRRSAVALTARRAWRRMVEARLHGRLLVHRVELLLAELGHVRALVPGGLLLRHRRTCCGGGGGARRPRRRCSEQTRIKGAARLARHQEGKTNGQTRGMSSTPPHEGRIEPTRARQKRSVATKLIAARTWLRVVLAPARSQASAPIALSPWTRRRHGAGSAHRSSGTGEITSPVTSNCSQSRNWCAIASGRHRCMWARTTCTVLAAGTRALTVRVRVAAAEWHVRSGAAFASLRRLRFALCLWSADRPGCGAHLQSARTVPGAPPAFTPTALIPRSPPFPQASTPLGVGGMRVARHLQPNHNPALALALAQPYRSTRAPPSSPPAARRSSSARSRACCAPTSCASRVPPPRSRRAQLLPAVLPQFTVC